MHNTYIKLSSVAVIALALWMPTAHSEEIAPDSPWQVNLSMGARTENLPTFDAPVGDTFVVGHPGLISKKFKPPMYGGEGDIVYTTRSGWDIGFGGGYWSGDDKTSAHPVFGIINQYGLSVTGLDGATGSLVGASTLEGDSVYASVDASLMEMRLNLARDFKADGMILRPFAGVIFVQSSQDYRASFRLAEPVINNLELPYALTQDVDSNRLGGELGMRVTLPIEQDLHLHASAAFALFHQSTSMKAHDCLASGQFTPGFNCEDTTTYIYQRLLASTASDDDDRIASRVKLEGGLSYFTKLGVLSASGFAQYDSAVAGVKNPVMTQDQFLGGDPTRPPPSHLTFNDAWSYGGKVSFTVPLQ